MKSKIKPTFNKKIPKGAAAYFMKESDDEFKQEHPIGYVIFVAIALGALMIPITIYLWVVLTVFPVPDSNWIIMGFWGAFIIGTGLFNIVAAWVNQHLGHKVTFFCFLIGAILVVNSRLALYG